MTYREFNAFCASLPATTYVVQWGGAHVWKVGGKVFAIGGWQRLVGVAPIIVAPRVDCLEDNDGAALEFAVAPLADTPRAIREYLHALTMALAVEEPAGILLAIRECEGS
ncbi:hypothetical protein [uncultured Parvibaculum sp.]|uniref:MmcQ/YjbR family DNA-binding protein n=1 Tax=uncultured Parvibaculum sp. TaxID=291828 RepID=UPI0030DBA2DE